MNTKPEIQPGIMQAVFDCIGGPEELEIISTAQLKELTLKVIMPLLLEGGSLGDLGLILHRLVLTATQEKRQNTPNKGDSLQEPSVPVSVIEWQAVLDALETTERECGLVSDAHIKVKPKIKWLIHAAEKEQR
jgi:hypothetical protein